jgi:ribosomal protein S18 acetylase RimI-like enzyme
MHQIIPAASKSDLAQTAALFREYAVALGVNLDFQNFEAEVAGLPGHYAPPDGRLFLAFINHPRAHSPAEHPAAGCIALRRMDATTCEMKRLYVRPNSRGHGLGRKLAAAVIDAACEIGYQSMRLDTLPQMSEAQTLYHSLGFQEIPPYCFNPIPGSHFLELKLRQQK